MGFNEGIRNLHLRLLTESVRSKLRETPGPRGHRLPDRLEGAVRLFPYGDLLPELQDVIEAQWTETKRIEKEKGIVVPWVFHRRGKPIKNFREAWQSACRKAGVPGRIPHDFRRTACRNLVRAGVPETVAMTLTGHKTRSVFDRYNVTSETDLREAVAKLATGTEKGQSAPKGQEARLRRPAQVSEGWCRRWESNPHEAEASRDFESRASASFATPAGAPSVAPIPVEAPPGRARPPGLPLRRASGTLLVTRVPVPRAIPPGPS